MYCAQYNCAAQVLRDSYNRLKLAHIKARQYGASIMEADK
jgi:hypothetical protein